MKYLPILLLTLMATVCVAHGKTHHHRVRTHWVEIARENHAVVYVDDAEIVVDGEYNGLKTLVFLPKPEQTEDGITVVSMQSLFEINCKTEQSRFKDTLFIDDSGQDHQVIDQWQPVESPLAVVILESIKNRVCSKSN